MSNIRKAFDHGKAFIPFITCGDPDLETTAAAVREAVKTAPISSSWAFPSPTPPRKGRSSWERICGLSPAASRRIKF